MHWKGAGRCLYALAAGLVLHLPCLGLYLWKSLGSERGGCGAVRFWCRGFFWGQGWYAVDAGFPGITHHTLVPPTPGLGGAPFICHPRRHRSCRARAVFTILCTGLDEEYSSWVSQVSSVLYETLTITVQTKAALPSAQCKPQ